MLGSAEEGDTGTWISKVEWNSVATAHFSLQFCQVFCFIYFDGLSLGV